MSGFVHTEPEQTMIGDHFLLHCQDTRVTDDHLLHDMLVVAGLGAVVIATSLTAGLLTAGDDAFACIHEFSALLDELEDFGDKLLTMSKSGVTVSS